MAVIRAGEGVVSKTDLRYDQRGAVVWLYCMSTVRRRVVKIGISGNVPHRAQQLRSDAQQVLRKWFDEPLWKQKVYVVRTWPLDVVTRKEARAIESVVLGALRDVAGDYAGEWFQVDAFKAVATIEAVCGKLGCIARVA